MRTSGFSIAEFVISITIMLIVSVSVLPMLLKKAKKPANPVRMVGQFTCVNKDSCTFDTENSPIKDKEFITIDLVGGGAGGSNRNKGRGGSAGQLKTIHLPAMSGKYTIELGEGGSEAQNGGDTILKKGNQIIEYARGGVSNREITSVASERIGEESPMSIDGVAVGKGGDTNGSGSRGGAIIKW